MLRLDDNKYFTQRFTYGIWFLMAFQAGYVNIGGLFTSGSFVSHVTGTSSRIGQGIANLDSVILLTFCTVLLAFIGGAAFVGHYIGRQKEEGREPRYLFVLTLKAFFFGFVLLLSHNDSIQILNMDREHINILIIFLLSFCCGVQNSTCSLATQGFLKPTHMTGLSTDLGIHLTQIFAWKKQRDKYREERKKIILRSCILLSFIFGGVISTIIFTHNGYYGFLFPFISSLCLLSTGIMRDIKKMGSESFAFRVAKSSVVATFIMTLFVSVSSLIKYV